MKKALFAFAAIAAALTSCQMADEFAPKADKAKEAIVFTGVIDPATRSTISQNGDNFKVCWTADTKVAVVGLKADESEGVATYTAAEGGSDYTYFNMLRGDTLVAGPFKAYSPAGVKNAFPGVQSQVNGVLNGIPMVAESATQALSFKMIGGLLKLDITTKVAGAAVKTIVIATDQPMAGAYTLTDGVAVIAEDGKKSITLECGDGVAIGETAVSFYVAVPANTYTGMSIKVNTADGKSQTIKMKAGASVKIDRAKYYEAAFAFDKLEATTVGGTAILPCGMDFNGFVKQLAQNDPLLTYANYDYAVTKIVFDTNSANTNGIEIQDMASEKPIYLSADPATGVAIVSTPAAELALPADGSYMFASFGALEEIVNLKSVNTSACENMSYMFCFNGCDFKSLKHIDLSGFNTENVTTMRSMFNTCTVLEELDLSTFNTANCESMRFMFQYCGKLKSLDLSSFNTENATDMGYMFAYCYELEKVNVSSFNTENCGDMTYFFAYCYKLNNLDLKNFDVSNVVKMGNFFWNCRELSVLDISSFNPSSATEIRSFFNRCYMLQNIDLSNFNPESITGSSNCGYFFFGTIGLKNLYCGETFRFPILPSYPFSEKWNYPDLVAGYNNGGFTIWCSQDIADYWATSGLRWLHNGNGDTCPAQNIVFKDWKTGVEIQPAEWKAN